MVATQAPKAPARDSLSLTSASASLRLSTQQSKQPQQQRPDARSTLSTTNRSDRNDNSFGNRNALDNRSAPSRANSANHGNSHGNNHRSQGNQGSNYSGSHNQQNRSRQEAPKPKPQVAVPETVDLDMEVDTPISIRGVAPGESVAFRGESGPVTIEIENLDPGTTEDDVKVLCLHSFTIFLVPNAVHFLILSYTTFYSMFAHDSERSKAACVRMDMPRSHTHGRQLDRPPSTTCMARRLITVRKAILARWGLRD